MRKRLSADRPDGQSVHALMLNRAASEVCKQFEQDTARGQGRQEKISSSKPSQRKMAAKSRLFEKSDFDVMHRSPLP